MCQSKLNQDLMDQAINEIFEAVEPDALWDAVNAAMVAHEIGGYDESTPYLTLAQMAQDRGFADLADALDEAASQMARQGWERVDSAANDDGLRCLRPEYCYGCSAPLAAGNDTGFCGHCAGER